MIFEITETPLVHNEGVAQVFIESVRRLDCGVALDDFGTGYGSFRYLKHLPVNLLKIDQLDREVHAAPENPRGDHEQQARQAEARLAQTRRAASQDFSTTPNAHATNIKRY